MRILLGMVGAFMGVVLADWAAFHFVAGGLLGMLLGWVINLQAELTQLRRVESPPARPQQPKTAASPRPAQPATPPPREPVPPPVHPSPPTPEHWSAPANDRLRAKPAPSGSTHDDAITASLRRGRDWLLSGNVPVKLGVLISFFGIAFLLKYSIDHQILRMPVTVWLTLVGAAGLGLVALGWRIRERRRVYAISVQGGGIGILYLTIFAAFRLFEVLPALVAFFVLFSIAVAAGWLAYIQRAQALAVLGSVGGYLAPLLASTGTGDHVALFGYYLLLNGGVFGLAWFTAWRWLNLIGFLFTFVVGTWWGIEFYRPELYASTQPFLAAFFLIYTTIAVLFALRQPPKLKGVVDGTLVFGTPLLAFPLQAALLRDSEYGLAWSAVVVAVIYSVYAFALRRFAPEHTGLLREAFAALALGFVTLAVPLALDAEWTAAVWALEGAAIVWIGVRQRRPLMRLFGVGLVFIAGFSQMLASSSLPESASPILNGEFLGGALVTAAALVVVALLGRAFDGRRAYESSLRMAVFVWGVAWWLSTGIGEIQSFVPDPYHRDATLLYLAFGIWGGAWLSGKLRQPVFGVLVHTLLPVLGYVLLLEIVDSSKAHPFAELGWIAWPLAAAAYFDGVRRVYEMKSTLRERWWSAGMWLIGGLLFAEAHWLTADVLGAAIGWRVAASAAVLAIVFEATMRIGSRRDPVTWMQLGAGPLLAAILILLLRAYSIHDGSMAPLPYLPLLNPSDLAAAGALLLTLRWVRSPGLADIPQETRMTGGVIFALLAWVFLSFAVIRAVHHLAGVPYSLDAMLESLVAQAALTLVWATAGFALMVIGARRARRVVWVGGAALMGLVVLKLFLVDLGGTGTIERIVSFIGVGALLLVVGYYAPAPKSG